MCQINESGTQGKNYTEIYKTAILLNWNFWQIYNVVNFLNQKGHRKV